MVKEIAAGVFCLKVVRYAIYLWLPLYLKQEVDLSYADHQDMRPLSFPRSFTIRNLTPVSFQPCSTSGAFLGVRPLVSFFNGTHTEDHRPFSSILAFDVIDRFFNNEGCLGAAVETLLSAGTLVLFLAFSQAGVTINSILMIITGALNCGADIILCKSTSKKSTCSRTMQPWHCLNARTTRRVLTSTWCSRICSDLAALWSRQLVLLTPHCAHD